MARAWPWLHVEAFHFFGGVVASVVPDNLKAAVIRAAFGVDDSPALNRSYIELARHYGFRVDPAPPRAPKKKGKVKKKCCRSKSPCKKCPVLALRRIKAEMTSAA